MAKAGSNAGFTSRKTHDVSPKLCSDISGFLHQVPKALDVKTLKLNFSLLACY